ncbi:MAG: hypothetical protein WCW65_00030 [Candidatus Paceibacterota bacterium]
MEKKLNEMLKGMESTPKEQEILDIALKIKNLQDSKNGKNKKERLEIQKKIDTLETQKRVLIKPIENTSTTKGEQLPTKNIEKSPEQVKQELLNLYPEEKKDINPTKPEEKPDSKSTESNTPRKLKTGKFLEFFGIGKNKDTNIDTKAPDLADVKTVASPQIETKPLDIAAVPLEIETKMLDIKEVGLDSAEKEKRRALLYDLLTPYKEKRDLLLKQKDDLSLEIEKLGEKI